MQLLTKDIELNHQLIGPFAVDGEIEVTLDRTSCSGHMILVFYLMPEAELTLKSIEPEGLLLSDGSPTDGHTVTQPGRVEVVNLDRKCWYVVER